MVLLALATFAAFAGVLRNGWILFDDPLYVYENRHVTGGLTLDAMRWFLHHSHGSNWHPLTSYSHLLDVQLFGLNPAGHHAVSLALHVLNAVLLAVILHGLTGAWWRSLIVAGLFALHPLRVESVAWVSERKDVLSGAFFLLAIAAYGHWVRRPTGARRTLLVALFALGLMAKPMLVTLPFVLILLDVWPLSRLAGSSSPSRVPRHSLARLVTEKWPLFGLAAAAAAITFLVQQATGAMAAEKALPVAWRLANAAVSFWRYIGKTLWPTDLAVFYPFVRPPADGAAVAAFVGFAAATVWVLRQARARPYLATGWLWYGGMLVPVIGLVQVGGQAWADRYSYLPVIGLLIALVWGGGELVGRWRAGRRMAGALVVIALLALAVATARQVSLWKDTRTLFTHALAVTRDNAVAHQNLGNALLQAGEIEAGVAELETALRLRPDFPDAHNNLGSVLGAMGRYEEAIRHFRRALERVETAAIRYNLGYTYARLGRTDEAIAEYEAALRLDPDHQPSLLHLGSELLRADRFVEAATHLGRALAHEPGNNEARRLRAVALTHGGRIEEAIGEYRAILERAPEDLDAMVNIAWVRATHAEAEHRDGGEAVRLAEGARDRSPEPLAVVFSTLAAAYGEAGRFPEAERAGERAVALARAEGDDEAADRYALQLANYRASKPFRFYH